MAMAVAEAAAAVPMAAPMDTTLAAVPADTRVLAAMGVAVVVTNTLVVQAAVGAVGPF